MRYCHHCKNRVDEDEVFCPACGISLVGEDAVWQNFMLREVIGRTEQRGDAYTALAAILVTAGVVIGGLLFLASSALALFAIVFVCLGVACGTSASRHEHKARELRNQLLD